MDDDGNGAAVTRRRNQALTKFSDASKEANGEVLRHQLSH